MITHDLKISGLFNFISAAVAYVASSKTQTMEHNLSESLIFNTLVQNLVIFEISDALEICTMDTP